MADPPAQVTDSTGEPEPDPKPLPAKKAVDGTAKPDSTAVVTEITDPPPETKKKTESATAATTKAKDEPAKEPVVQPAAQSSTAEEPVTKPADPPPSAPREVLIAIMGQTGTGKTSFVNEVTGKQLKVGHGLECCM
jgi:ABC-type transport system involved in cytochrome bd biosynthesis fused ATPase/permease subunit